MTLRHFYLRPEWESIQQKVEDSLRTVDRVLGTAGALSLISLFAIQRMGFSLAWKDALSQAASLYLFGGLAVWFALYPGREATRKAIAFYLVLEALNSAVVVLTKAGLEVPMLLDPHRASSPVLYWGMLALVPLGFILYLMHSYPREFGKVGLHLSSPGTTVLLGLIGGAVLGMHCLASEALLGKSLFSPKPLPYVAWHFAYEAGLQSLTEEMFFRGALFGHLFFARRRGLWTAWLISGGLNTLFYLVRPQWVSNLVTVAGVIFYIAALSLLNSFLYARNRDLTGPYLSNLTFSLLLLLR